MYSTSLKNTDRSGAAIAAFAVQAALLAAFLNLSRATHPSETQPRLAIFDIARPDEFNTATKPQAEARSPSKPIVHGGGSRSAAKPASQMSAVIPIVPAKTSSQAPETISAGSAEAGDESGRGTGTGAGSGTGRGDDTGHGSGSAVQPPQLATRVLGAYDFPRDILALWPRNRTVFLRLRIDPRGYVSECLIDRGTDVPAIDADMCNTAHERLRFRPAIDNSGEAVAGWFGYAQPAPR